MQGLVDGGNEHIERIKDVAREADADTIKEEFTRVLSVLANSSTPTKETDEGQEADHSS